MIIWSKPRTPILSFIERWSYRIGLLIIFFLAVSFVKFAAEYYGLRSPL